MSVEVTKSSPVVVVGASEAATGTAAARNNISLSSFDKCLIPIPVTLLLVFDQAMEEPVETVKKALSQALVHYNPMAGRLATSLDGELYIACTGEGVSFVGASASCPLSKVTTSPVLLRELAMCYPAELCRLSDTLLLMQVTEFSCGGFVVGVTWNHVIADAAGMAQFLHAVGELASGMPAPSVVPLRSDALLPCLPPSMFAAVRSEIGFETEEMASLDVTIPSSLISSIKAKCGYNCTVFEAVAAVVWRCRTRAILSDPNAPALLAFAVNVRDLVGAKHGYYGNCVTMQLVQTTGGTVARSDIKDLVKLIKFAKEKVPDLFKDDGNRTSDGGVLPPRYNTLTMTSWRNLGFDAVDLGHGGPVRVMWHAEKIMALPCVVCPPCKGMDGVNVLSLCVKPEHADAFLSELAAFSM